MTTVDIVVAPSRDASHARWLCALPRRAFDHVLAWHRRRDGIRRLLELDDRMLRDAGFSRADIARLR